MTLTEDEELALELKKMKELRKKKKASQETADAIDKEATLVLKSLFRPTSVVTRECKHCNQHFQTDYAYKFYCTRKCLKSALEAVGIDWDPDKTEADRWGGEPPSTIYPETLKKLREWAIKILEHPVETNPTPEPIPKEQNDLLDRINKFLVE